MPGKKDYVSIVKNGEKYHLQKKKVLGNLKEIFQKFKEQHPTVKVGFSKFAMLCPKECVLAGASGTYSVCVCIAHNNIKLMMHGSSIANDFIAKQQSSSMQLYCSTILKNKDTVYV